MPQVADSIVMRGNSIKNRIVMLPMVTFSFKGDDGSYYGQQHVDHYAKAAKAGTGLIIVQSTQVQGVSNSTGMWTEGSISALTQIASNARAEGAVIMMQLSANRPGDGDIKLLSTAEVEERQAEMLKAALCASAMGFHGVEFHGAHGFTICKFLDAVQNWRIDKFGNSVEGRARIITDILPDIRQSTPAEFIVGTRMGGYTPSAQDGVEMAQTLEKAGIDLLNISFGMHKPADAPPQNFPFNAITYSAHLIKQAVRIPVIGLYELRTEAQAKRLLVDGYADMAGIGRGILADPLFTQHVLNSEPVNECLGCSECAWFTDHTLCPASE